MSNNTPNDKKPEGTPEDKAATPAEGQKPAAEQTNQPGPAEVKKDEPRDPIEMFVSRAKAAKADKQAADTPAQNPDPVKDVTESAITDEDALKDVANDPAKVESAIDDVLKASKDLTVPGTPAEPLVLTNAIPPAPPITPETPAEPTAAPKKKGWLRDVFFNAVCTGAVGFAVGTAVKMGVIATIGSPVVAVIVAAPLIAAATTAAQRALDIRSYNKEHQDGKLSYRKDFLNLAATGHDAMHYRKRMAISTAFAAGGGLLALSPIGEKVAAAVGGWLGFGGAPGVDVPAVVDTPIVETPVVDTPMPVVPPVIDTPVLDTPPVIADPVIEAPALQAPPVIDTPAIEVPAVDTPPVADTPVLETPPAIEAPAADTPPAAVEPPPPPVPTLDERVASVLDEAYGALPETPGRQLAETLSRLESTNDAVKAQALKDLGYFFANGFARLPEDDVLANKLFELSIEVSGGNNHQAMHDLGYHLIYGKGTAVDLERGRELLEAAAERGNRLSVQMLAQSPVLKP